MRDDRKRVMIVDDMATVRRVIRQVLDGDPGLVVVGEAADPYEARDLIKRLNPDVLTLDIEMPRMNGDEFLRKIMALRPMPVVMLSVHSRKGSLTAIKALAEGAVECIEKPKSLKNFTDDKFVAELRCAVRVAAISKVGAARPRVSRRLKRFAWNGRSVFLGASTGGVEALETILADYPENCPPTVIAQHMPANFIESFAGRLNERHSFAVSVAKDGDELKQGQVFFSPGGRINIQLCETSMHLAKVRSPNSAILCPSIDLLFLSAARLGPGAVAGILTGMGSDGANALKKMRELGCATIAQDSASCVVDGMPRVARTIEAASEVVALNKIGRRIVELCQNSGVAPN